MINKLSNYYRRKFWSSERYARHQGVKIGKNCDIQIINFGSEPYLIEIGNHVQITSGTKFFTHGGAWILREKFPKIDFFGKIIIGDNVYIGNNTLIMPGVTIGDNVAIGAGSVVTKDIPSNCVAVGTPARVIKSYDEYKEKMIPQFDLIDGLNSKEKKEYLIKKHNLDKS